MSVVRTWCGREHGLGAGGRLVGRKPAIFADTLAEAMLGERADELIGYHRGHGTHPVLSGARAQVTCRSRYTEDRLADGARRGIGQYVILGAGLDSFAGRSRLAGLVRVFEVDHPVTQDYKRRMLPAAAIDATLTVIGGCAPGSEIVVDYMLPAGWRDAAGDTYADLVGQESAERGEPWRSLFTPDAMGALVRRHRCRPIRDIGQHDMVPATAWDRSDSLHPVELSRITHAAINS